MKILELVLLEAASLDSVAKQHSLKKVALPRYHDARDVKRYALQTSKGKTVIEVEVTPKDSYDADPKGPIRVRHARKTEFFKKMADAVAHIEKLTVEIDDAALPDEKIIKWLCDQWGTKVKAAEFKQLGFIEWGPKVTQVVERGTSGGFELPYLTFIDGDHEDDDRAPLGEINMTTKDFREWLVKQGGKKMPKPKRSYSASYYD